MHYQLTRTLEKLRVADEAAQSAPADERQLAAKEAELQKAEVALRENEKSFARIQAENHELRDQLCRIKEERKAAQVAPM